ncbi:MAG: MBL fold metallo-hydrolase [Planctomycetota bacterium]
MIPKPPPREGSLGFLYIPPYRVQGTSIAGETTVVQVPELDVCFDIGECPRAVLPSKYVCIGHGHMDHVGGLGYFCSQRRFQGMGDANVVCHPDLATPIRRMMAGFSELEGQNTPYNLIPLAPDEEIEIKNNIYLRAFKTEHTDTSMGYAVVERRSKLKPEYVDLPQEKLRELKDRGEDITRILQVPLVAYVGDTAPTPEALVREDVRNAQIVIAECTFVEKDHKGRAAIGKHLHISDIAEWLPLLGGEKLVLIHLSRRSNIRAARKYLAQSVKREHLERVEFLMDHRQNRERYDAQAIEAERMAAARAT